MSVKAAAEALQVAVGAVNGVRLHKDLGGTIAPDAVVVGPPSLTWEAYCLEPTGATFVVWVITKADKRAVERLWELVPLVATALDGVDDATVSRADPGSYPSGGTELPAYSIQVDVALNPGG